MIPVATLGGGDLFVQSNKQEVDVFLSLAGEWSVDQHVFLMLVKFTTVWHQKGGHEGLLVV